MEIGNKILELRKQKNLSQEQLAEKIDVARQTISKWELGETSPDISQAKELSKIFNVSLDELTSNDIKDVIIKKVDDNNNLIKTIINILKIILLVIVILVIILVSVIFFKDYFDVQPVSTMKSIECSIEGIDYNYQVWMNNETSYIIDKIVTNDKEINIDVTQYINIEQLFEDIEANVVSRGGYCE